MSLPAAALERSFIFDAAVHGDAPWAAGLPPSECLRPIRRRAHRRIWLFAPRHPPAGSLRLYAAAEAGGGLITTASIPYIAPDEAVELPLGPATGIIVTRTRAEAKEVNQRLDAANKVALYDLQERWELEARNLRAEPVELLVREHHEGVWVLEQADVRPEREDAETLRFRLTLAPGDRATISYRIRHVGRSRRRAHAWGQRVG